MLGQLQTKKLGQLGDFGVCSLEYLAEVDSAIVVDQLVSSRCIDLPRGADDLVAIGGIGILFQGPYADQINLTAGQPAELVLHREMVEHSPVRIGGERDQQVDIAVRAQHTLDRRAEDGQAADLPPTAELLDLLL
jgi:hypothetical protein